MKHPHIAQLYELVETDDNYYLVMEHCSGGELFDHIVDNGRLKEDEASKLYQQLLSVLKYLHGLGIVHRDLKPENILLDDNLNLKIIDFGLSNEYREGQMLSTICGSPNYISPEMILRKPYEGLKVDVWCSGVTLFAMLCGYLPFADDNVSRLKDKIRSARFEMPEFLSDDARDLLSSILVADPCKRFSF